MRSPDWSLDAPRDGWARFDDHWRRDDAHRDVGLEQKCQSRVPWWMTDLVRKHALQRRSFSKYSVGVYLTGLPIGEDRLGRRSARWLR